MTDTALTPDRIDELRATVRDLMPALRADLESLVRIPSISLGAYDQRHVDSSAEAVAELLRAEGLDVRIVREGGRPAVIGTMDGPPGSPRITLYAHHDVQPVGDEALWDSPPFEPTERDGRLCARGAGDDKAGVMMHVAALRALGARQGRLPVGVTVFVEGEEEIGSESLPHILARHADVLRGDAIVLADSGNWQIGVPSLTVNLRGIVRAIVTVRTMSHAVHSGMFGGPVADATTAAIRLLDTLHDDDGNVAVAGLDAGAAAEPHYPEDRFRADSGVLDGVDLIGSGTLVERLWVRPSLTVIGMDIAAVDTAANVMVPALRAKLSMRIAPGQDPERAFALLREHLMTHAPWGAQVEVELDEAGPGFAGAVDGPIAGQARASLLDAWGTEPVDIGVGGSIPFVAAFAEQFPGTEILITGVEDPDCRAHGANESLHLGEWERACLAETLLLARLGESGASRA